MKKIALTLLLLCVLVLPAAAANRVDSIAVEATLYEDGSMYVVQTWDGSFDQGTENYIPMNLPHYVTITDLQVNDGDGTYETLDHWDIDWDFAQKARKCGVRSGEDGYEICFGISDYGDKRYAIEYRLDHVVAGFTDRDGVNFRFVNDGMNTTPTDVTVKIHLWDGRALTDDIADVWAFGFEGQVGFADGTILAYTEVPLASKNHVTLLLGLEKGILSPARVVEDSFETLQQRAFEGSDYDSGEDDFPGAIFVGLCVIGVLVVLFLVVGQLHKRGQAKKLRAFSEKFGYFRDLPNGGNVSVSYTLGRHFDLCEEGAILATGMLRLIDRGCLTPVSREDVGFFGRTKEQVTLKLEGSPNTPDPLDGFLYAVLEGAAGEDGVLQPKELERFATHHDTLLRDYLTRQEQEGDAYLRGRNCLKRGDIAWKLSNLTETGQVELGELMGFRRYLEDFSLIDQRGVGELPIWKELLSYAMLFGIADKVAQQLKELYPKIAPEVVHYQQNLYAAYSYHYFLYSGMRNAEAQRQQARRSSGSGGFSSLGGGGGSMGGGSGGGSR